MQIAIPARVAFTRGVDRAPGTATDPLAARGAQDVERLLWRLLVVLAVMVPVEWIAGIITGARELTLAAAVVGVFGAVVAIVIAFLRRHNLTAAYLTFAVGVLAVTAAVSRIYPNGPATGIAPLMIIAVALPFLSGRRLAAVVVPVWFVTSAIVALQELAPPVSGVSPQAEAAMRVAAFVLAGALVLYLLTRFSSALHAMRQQADDRLVESQRAEAAYSALVEGVPVGLFRAVMSNGRLRLSEANGALARILGFASRETLLGQPLDRLYPGLEDAPLTVPSPTGQPIVTEAVINGGDGATRVVRVTWSGSAGVVGGEAEFRGVVEDLTQQRAAEQSATRIGERMATFLEHASVGMAVMDLDFRFVEVNRALCEMLALRPQDLLGRRCDDFVHPDERSIDARNYKLAQEHPGSRRPNVAERRWIAATGDLVWFRMVVSIIWSTDGRAQFGVGTFENVTETKVTAAALEREQAERARITSVLSSLQPGSDAEATAAAICTCILQLPEFDLAGVYDLSNGEVVPIAVVAPDSAPAQKGRPLSASVGRHLRRRAALGPWYRTWSGEGTRYERDWYASGLRASGYVPISWEGRVVGVLFAGSSRTTTEAEAERWMSGLAEYGLVAAALLGRQLAERRAGIVARSDVLRLIGSHGHRPVFQPIVRLGDRRVVGYEALTRFTTGDPETWFARAATVGLGADLQAACLHDSLTEAVNLPPGWLSVNVSVSTVTTCAEIATATMNRDLVIEVTEEEAVEDYAELRRNLASIGGQARLAVDDAGAGFSSLRHIVELRPQFVKLAMHIVRGVDTDAARQAIVAGMVHFARQAGSEIIAEGIETDAEVAALKELGVGLGQGYLLGRPARAAELSATRRAPSSGRDSTAGTSSDDGMRSREWLNPAAGRVEQ